MHLWHYERLSELLGKLQARFPEPVWRELAQAVSAHSTRVTAPRAGRAPPPALAQWAEWDRPFDTIPGENIQGTVSSPQAVHCAAGSLIEGAIWAGSGITVERNVVVEGPVVSREQIDWQGRRAQSLIAPRVRLGRPAFPLDIRGSLLCQVLVLGADACLAGALDGSLVVTRHIVRRDSGADLSTLFVLPESSADGLDVPCAAKLDHHVRLGQLCAGGNIVLGEGCRIASASGENVVVGAGCTVSHVYARGTLVLGPGSTVQTAIAQGRITADPTARIEGDLIASACGEVEIGGEGWFSDPLCHYRADVAALLDSGTSGGGAQGGLTRGWAAVRHLPHALYRQLEGLHRGWCAALDPIDAGSTSESAPSQSTLAGEAA